MAFASQLTLTVVGVTLSAVMVLCIGRLANKKLKDVADEADTNGCVSTDGSGSKEDTMEVGEGGGEIAKDGENYGHQPSTLP